MTLRQKFLLWFAEYRDVLDRAQRAEDEAIRQRGIAENTQKRLDALNAQFLAREMVMTDRYMGIKHGPQIMLTPEQIAEQLGNPTQKRDQERQQDARAWVRTSSKNVINEIDKLAASL